MILAASCEFDRMHNAEVQERPSDNEELPQVCRRWTDGFLSCYCKERENNHLLCSIYRFVWGGGVGLAELVPLDSLTIFLAVKCKKSYCNTLLYV
jgi:hypothetical protein